DTSGAIRIGDSRLLLELVIRAFQDGATAEEIAERYPSAPLADIYAAITYYLRHTGHVEAYLSEREQSARQVREKIEHHHGDLAELRQRLSARSRPS
ncbi:DUF433 domain-containing protein, partial [Candidatus Sumerlaeota bacterium]|nr:DUF433 domain-containing protein [Candidatus Sumerlaeota bacterium]